MTRLKSVAIASLMAVSVAATSAIAPASAGQRDRDIGLGILAGALGGAIIASELSRNRDARVYDAPRDYYRPRHREYREPRYEYRERHHHGSYYREEPRVIYETRPVYIERRAAPRSDWQRHVDRCYATYRSYNESTDTFIGYDGYERRCRL